MHLIIIIKTIAILLDFIKSFDTVYYKELLNILSEFGIIINEFQMVFMLFNWGNSKGYFEWLGIEYQINCDALGPILFIL